jgi:uncharacterized protein (TIGR00251 family)
MTVIVLEGPPRLRFSVRVQPRASRTRIAGEQGDALKVQLTAPPVDGAANEALVEVLAAALGVPRRSVAIVSGGHSRRKVLEVAAPDIEELRRRLMRLTSAASAPRR